MLLLKLIRVEKLIKRSHHESRLLIILLFGFIASLPLLLSPMVAEPDAYSRAVNAALFKQQMRLYQFKESWMWLPFHFIILGGSLFLYDNIFFTPRFVTLLFSLGAVALMYYYTLLIVVGKKNLALLAALIYLFFPLHFFLATMTLSEPIFIFFLLAALIVLFREKPNFLGGLILLNIAHGIRYESWMILPFIWWLIVKSGKLSLKRKIELIFISLIFPFFWLYANIFLQKQPFTSFSFLPFAYKRAIFLPEYLNFPASFQLWKQKMIDLVSLPFLLIALYGGYCLLKNNFTWRQHLMLVLPLYLFILLVIQTFAGTKEWFPHRYLYTVIVLGMPFLATGMAKIYSSLRNKIKRKYYPWLALSLLMVISIYSSLIIQTRKFTSTFVDAESNLFDVIKVYRDQKRKNKNIKPYYYYTEEETPWFESAFQYFLQDYYMPIQSKSKMDLNDPNAILIVEKDREGEAAIYPKRYNLIYENKTMMLLRPK